MALIGERVGPDERTSVHCYISEWNPGINSGRYIALAPYANLCPV